jgi:ABC-type transport system involved in multi-copper enzyme maturation permease subunit
MKVYEFARRHFKRTLVRHRCILSASRPERRLGRPPHSFGWGGDVAGWELTRLARRGLPTVARLLVALLLFAALFITFLAAFPVDIDVRNPSAVQARLSQFGRDFALAFLLVQAAVVLLLTPLFVAGAIVEETERRTLEFLLATDLSPREIILGKLWPRLLLVLAVVMAGWPVLATTQVWGGVEFVSVAMSSFVLLAEMWAIAGISAACAVGAKSLRKALVRAYSFSILALVMPVCTCPFGMIVFLTEADGSNLYFGAGGRPVPGAAQPPPPSAIEIYGPLIAALFVHLSILAVIGILGLRRATFKLRHARYFYARMPWQERPRKLQHWEKHPPVPEGSPLLWKEMYLSGQTNRFVKMLSLVPWVVWLCVCSVLMVLGWAAILGGSEGVLDSMNGLIRWGGGAVMVLMCLMAGLHAAGAVSRERQRETLDSLITIPRPRHEILWAKWIGSVSKARGIALGALAIPLVGVLAEGLSYWAVLPLFLAAGAFVACAASFGLWLSVRIRTVQRATGVWLLAVGLWVGGTFMAAQAAYVEQYRTRSSRIRSEPLPAVIWDRALNPLLAWSQLTFRVREANSTRYYWEEWRDGEIDGVWETFPSLLGVGLYAFLAWGFYVAASRRFEREGRG